MRFETKWALLELGEGLDPFIVQEAITSGDLTARRSACAALSEVDQNEATNTLVSRLRLT